MHRKCEYQSKVVYMHKKRGERGSRIERMSDRYVTAEKEGGAGGANMGDRLSETLGDKTTTPQEKETADEER